MIEAWKKQFSLKQLSLVHDTPITFIISQWQRKPKPHIIYLVYRWIVALIFSVSLVIAIVDLKHPDASGSYRAKWLIYLTNWGYSMCTIQSLVVAVVLSLCALAPRLPNAPNLKENALKLYKLYWATNTIATDIAISITALYWSLIFDEKTMDLDAMNILVHANNSVLMMIDLFVVSHPIRLVHFCYPVVFGICYALFSVIFYAAGGISREGHTYIYTILDWDQAGKTTGICFGVLVFLTFVHTVVWGLHKLRLWIHSKLFSQKDEDKFVDDKNTANLSYFNEGLASDIV